MDNTGHLIGPVNTEEFIQSKNDTKWLETAKKIRSLSLEELSNMKLFLGTITESYLVDIPLRSLTAQEVEGNNKEK